LIRSISPARVAHHASRPVLPRLLWCALLLASPGCGDGSPAAILRTGSPADAAGKALQLHDSNQDGKLDTSELGAVPSLAGSVRRIDSNRDGAIAQAELEARFNAHDAMADLATFDVEVLQNGSPLDGAVVTFTAEPFMGEGKQAYVGTTTANGMCGLVGESVQIPGVPIGFYRVRIVHAASGADVNRGCEVATDLPTANRLAFDTKVAGPIASGGR
jgi:hypothetical protein